MCCGQKLIKTSCSAERHMWMVFSLTALYLIVLEGPLKGDSTNFFYVKFSFLSLFAEQKHLYKAFSKMERRCMGKLTPITPQKLLSVGAGDRGWKTKAPPINSDLAQRLLLSQKALCRCFHMVSNAPGGKKQTMHISRCMKHVAR